MVFAEDAIRSARHQSHGGTAVPFQMIASDRHAADDSHRLCSRSSLIGFDRRRGWLNGHLFRLDRRGGCLNRHCFHLDLCGSCLQHQELVDLCDRDALVEHKGLIETAEICIIKNRNRILVCVG